MIRKQSLLFMFTFLMVVTTVMAQDLDKAARNSTDSKIVLGVLEAFKTSIIENDSSSAVVHLTEDARILESGGIETRDEYLSHHFHSDGRFLSAMERELLSRTITSNENTAWIASLTQMQGTLNDREINLTSAELAVLVKTDEGWKISAIHWSSRSGD